MATRKTNFEKVLQDSELIVKELGIEISYTHNLDPYFKGDLDGKTIFIGGSLPAEEKVFNLLHLAGHTIQWNISALLRDLGSELYRNPGDELLKLLQTYEWEANCYALTILHKAEGFELDGWLRQKYIIDMLYLTHFYKTGQKLKRITEVAKAYTFNRELEIIEIPEFEPTASKRTRNGLVISF